MNPKPDKPAAPPPDFEPRLGRLLATLLNANAGIQLDTDKLPPVPDLDVLTRMTFTGTDADISLLKNYKNWRQQNTSSSRDKLNAALHETLADILNLNAPSLVPAVVEALRPLTEELNIETLAEWLGRGGWDKVNGDKVEAHLVA